MSGSSFLLDTNIVIGFFANEPSVVKQIKRNPSGIFVPSIVLGELFYGAEQSSRREENIKKIEVLGQASSILECNIDTARLYGRIKSQLKAKGSPIPENDIWIAALARQYQMILVTRDKHFDNIEALKMERWER